jgi:hypothetical protein
VDASALRADEGRGIAAISAGEPCAGIDPAISEWGNPTTNWSLPHRRDAEGTGGTETSHVPRGTDSIPVVAASEPGLAQTGRVSSRQALRARGWKPLQAGLPPGTSDQVVHAKTPGTRCRRP